MKGLTGLTGLGYSYEEYVNPVNHVNQNNPAQISGLLNILPSCHRGKSSNPGPKFKIHRQFKQFHYPPSCNPKFSNHPMIVQRPLID